MARSSALIFGRRPATCSGLDAGGERLPRFEPCGCSGGYAHCVGLGSPECCGACDEPCLTCNGFGTRLAIKPTSMHPGDEDEREWGFTTINLDEAPEHLLELAQRNEDERLRSLYRKGSAFAPIQVLGPGHAVVPSDDEIPF